MIERIGLEIYSEADDRWTEISRHGSWDPAIVAFRTHTEHTEWPRLRFRQIDDEGRPGIFSFSEQIGLFPVGSSETWI